MRTVRFIPFVAASILVACGGDDRASPGDILSAASEAMAMESFSHTISDCPLCPPPIVTEYAPPDAVKRSNSKGHDDWPYNLILDGKGYVSSAGQRWRSGEGALSFTGMLISDPRTLLPVAKNARIETADTVAGRRATVIAAELDFDKYVVRLPPAIEHPDEAFLREWLGAARLRFWIDRENHRVLQTELTSANANFPSSVFTFDYATPVAIPATVESMHVEDAARLGFEAEMAGQTLLTAVADYRETYGTYPRMLDITTLSGVIAPGEWPINPFSGQPVRQSPDTPGDFDYRLINGGQDIQFSIYGWDDGQLHYDTARFGPLDRAALGGRWQP